MYASLLAYLLQRRKSAIVVKMGKGDEGRSVEEEEALDDMAAYKGLCRAYRREGSNELADERVVLTDGSPALLRAMPIVADEIERKLWIDGEGVKSKNGSAKC